MRKSVFIFLVLLCSASVAFPHATVEQKTQMQFGGFIGGVMNVFGGKATREGITTTSVVRGDRRSSVTGKTGELVDLKEEKIYQIDYGRKTYKVVTFDELRKQWEDAQKQMKEQSREQETRDSGNAEKAPEYEIDVDVKETGEKETINGFNTRQAIVTVTAHEKGMKLKDSGGAVLTADLWLGPKIAALRELDEFNRRYFQKLYGGINTGGDARSMAMLISQSPAFTKAMKKFQDKQASLDGSAVRTSVKFEVVPDPRNPQAESSPSGSGDAASRMIGGLMNKAKRNKEASQTGEPSDGRKMLFSSKTELISATGESTESALAIPAGFKERD
jgi:hypothetical protein